MGVLEKYKYVNNYGIEVEPPKGYTPPVTKKERKYVAPEAIPVTVADTNPTFCRLYNCSYVTGL